MGDTVVSQFQEGFPEVVFGVITGTFNVSQFPNIPGRLFRLKARSNNAGSIFVGDNINTGSFPRLPWEFEASYDTGWFPGDNLNEYYQAGSSGTSYLSYWIMR